jgi:glycosyltransferase involved in cell wall biosynthesis
VWVGSRYSAGIFARSLQQPVLAVPYGVIPAERIPLPADTRTDQTPPSGFLFLFCFDALSFERKNPLGLIEAFSQAFRPGEGPKLVIKSTNGDHTPEQMALLRQRAALHPDITLIDGHLDSGALQKLLRSADAYVSLHRAEGWGMSIAESMADGKPVIATRHSGNLDYMTDETSFLVDWDSARVSPGTDRWIETGSIWAEPRLDQAAEYMRRVFRDPEAARVLGQKAAEHMRKNHSIAISAQIVRRRLDSLGSART